MHTTISCINSHLMPHCNVQYPTVSINLCSPALDRNQSSPRSEKSKCQNSTGCQKLAIEAVYFVVHLHTNGFPIWKLQLWLTIAGIQ